MLRVARVLPVAVVAAFFTVVTYSDVVDFDTNYAFVQHVLGMDTTFQSPHLMGRAIADQRVHLYAYWAIILRQGLTVLVCWIGALRLVLALAETAGDFQRAKGPAAPGLIMGFLLYGLGILVVAGESFAMWHSHEWNAQATAGMFTTVILAALVLLAVPEPAEG
jgi:predicted small integral membrane protein